MQKKNRNYESDEIMVKMNIYQVNIPGRTNNRERGMRRGDNVFKKQLKIFRTKEIHKQVFRFQKHTKALEV